jgi:hypothetical protein
MERPGQQIPKANFDDLWCRDLRIYAHR